MQPMWLCIRTGMFFWGHIYKHRVKQSPESKCTSSSVQLQPSQAGNLWGLIKLHGGGKQVQINPSRRYIDRHPYFGANYTKLVWGTVFWICHSNRLHERMPSHTSYICVGSPPVCYQMCPKIVWLRKCITTPVAIVWLFFTVFFIKCILKLPNSENE